MNFKPLCIGTACAAILMFSDFLCPSVGWTQSTLEKLNPSQLRARLEKEMQKGSKRNTIPLPGEHNVRQITDFELLAEIRARGGTKPIYNSADDRRDYFGIYDSNVKEIAKASVALFKPERISISDYPQGVEIISPTLGEKLELCKSEQFGTQVAGAYCSGTLVKNDTVLTAGHCVGEIRKTGVPKVKDITFAFDYFVKSKEDHGPRRIDANYIYRGSELLGGALISRAAGGDDWALVKLDRPVSDDVAVPVSKRLKGRVANNASVFVVGYPSGLPLKYAPGAQVTDNGPKRF